MFLYSIAKLLHVLAAFWFVAGLLGRDIAFWRAARASDVHEVSALLNLSDFFERWGVILSSILVSILGLLVTWMLDWPLFGFLQGAGSNWLLVSAFLSLAVSAIIPAFGLVARRRKRAQALQDALAQGRLTGELRAALNDRTVNTFRKAELAIIALIIILMVTKPF